MAQGRSDTVPQEARRDPVRPTPQMTSADAKKLGRVYLFIAQRLAEKKEADLEPAKAG
jgi:hypothetical protein